MCMHFQNARGVVLNMYLNIYMGTRTKKGGYLAVDLNETTHYLTHSLTHSLTTIPSSTVLPHPPPTQPTSSTESIELNPFT